jgi:predicted acyltransferase
METAQKRLASLDLLRGFDLFMLLMFQPIFMQWLSIKNDLTWSCITAQFEHTEWHGFTCWDIIMPLFMFMSGITIPFALSKYKNKTKQIDGFFYWKIGKRFLILFFLGWIVQGNLLALDPHYFYVYANTLQAIAVGYIVAVILYVYFPMKIQIGFCVLFFIIYLVVFATAGHMNYAPGTNISEVIDRTVLGRFRNGIMWQNGIWHFDDTYHYTWILSSLNFIVTVMLGCFAGYILKSSKGATKKLKILVLIGVVLIMIAIIMDPIFPIIKRIWSSSMTLLSGGICFLLMALFYYIVDIKEYRKGIDWLKYYGMNSLVAYSLFEIVKFTSVSDSLFFGLKQWMGIYYPIVAVCVQATIVFCVVRWMYRHQIFVKA